MGIVVSSLRHLVGGFRSSLKKFNSFLWRIGLGSEVETMSSPTHPLKNQDIDTEAITARYQAERLKRLRTDGVAQFKRAEGKFSNFKNDTRAPPLVREPINQETKVIICGAGFGGLVTSVKLKEQGVNDFLCIDKGADWGGTWYWNQYPGAACDVESFIYLPFLEETGYIPKDRFSYGPEIRAQVERCVQKWDLKANACLQTEITSMVWDESIRRWHVRTNHNDHFVTQFVVLATGTFHEPKLPGLPGIENFKRDHFHSGRWNYEVTGGDHFGNLTGLKDKTVGVIGTGASAIQIIPQIAKYAKKLYVFQRTPSSVTLRENYKIDDSVRAELGPGWQRERMRVFANVLQGVEMSDIPCTAMEGLEPLTMRSIFKEAADAGVQVDPAEIPQLLQLADFRVMESIRRNVSETVKDPATAEKLKPWYAFMCKRPAFHNDYIKTFNEPNVELVDTGGSGVSCVTETGLVAEGKEYEVDLLIYSTGFDFEIESNFAHRTGIHLVGTQGRTLDQAWAKDGPSTYFGMHIREFPNLFVVGPNQAGVTANWTHTTYVAGDHIAEVVSKMLDPAVAAKFQAIEPTSESEQEWGKMMDEGSDMRLAFAKTCPPGYYNREGKPEEIPPRWGYFPKGINAWEQMMEEWRAEGNMKGMEKR